MQTTQKKAERTMNPFFSDDASDYLEANGFKRSEGKHSLFDTITFNNWPLSITVSGDTITFLVYDDGEEDQRRPGFSKFCSFTGISDLDFLGWVMLFHITGVIKMKKLLAAIKKEDPDEMKKLVKQLFEHFTPKQNPDCY